MDLPDFNEFLESLDPDEMGSKIDQLIPLRLIEFNINDQKAFKNVLSMLYQQAAKDSVQISLLYLQAYHKWLQQYL